MLAQAYNKSSSLSSISSLKLAKVKEYLEEILVKGFIEPSSAAYALPVLFA